MEPGKEPACRETPAWGLEVPTGSSSFYQELFFLSGAVALPSGGGGSCSPGVLGPFVFWPLSCQPMRFCFLKEKKKSCRGGGGGL